MERITTSFVAALREKGVRVSPGESMDALRALTLGGVSGRESVRRLLRLTLVKNASEFPAFEEVFEEFFSVSRAVSPGLDGAALMTALIHVVEGDLVKLEAPEKKHDPDDPSFLVEEELSPEELQELVSLEETEDEAEGAEMMVQLEGYRGKMKDPSPSDYYMQNLPTVAFHQGHKTPHPPFTHRELSDMQEVVFRMLVRIRKDVQRMKEREHRGRLHVVRTIQKNYRHGMVPFLLALRRKKKEKPRLVVLCDVSYSVSHATRFMLLLLHTLQNRLMDVRSFVFNKELAEITPLLRNMPVNCLLETIDKGEIVNLDDNSDFGTVFSTFKEKHLESMQGKPAIIVMGDARNNYQEANEWALEEIREKAGYLLWLTPEDRENWKRGDCLLDLYGSYCDKVEAVRSVEELSLVVEDLFCMLYDHNDTRSWKGRSREPKKEEQLDYREYYTRSSGAAPAFDPDTRRSW